MSDGFPVRQGRLAANNITAATVIAIVLPDTIVAPQPLRVTRIQVIVAGSAAGAVYDSKATTGNTAANQVFVIPNTVGSYLIDHPCSIGIVVAPGTGQTVAVVYE